MIAVVGIVLAAGASTRLGRPKQLLRYRGKTLLQTVVDEARSSACLETAVVLGANAAAIDASLDAPDVTRLVNTRWAKGKATSIATGITWAVERRADAALMMVCDQPRLTSLHLNALIAEFLRTGEMVVSAYAGTFAVPMIFPRSAFRDLLEERGGLEGGYGGIRGTRRVTSVEWPDGACDVDTREDAIRLLGAAATLLGAHVSPVSWRTAVSGQSSAGFAFDERHESRADRDSVPDWRLPTGD
jgi:molybdenum cofactor cytidylyltransferase